MFEKNKALDIIHDPYKRLSQGLTYILGMSLGKSDDAGNQSDHPNAVRAWGCLVVSLRKPLFERWNHFWSGVEDGGDWTELPDDYSIFKDHSPIPTVSLNTMIGSQVTH